MHLPLGFLGGFLFGAYKGKALARSIEIGAELDAAPAADGVHLNPNVEADDATLKTGNPNVDRFIPYVNAAWEKLGGSFWQQGSDEIATKRRALIHIAKESAGLDRYMIGDEDKGISVGPMQVNRPTAIGLSLVPANISAEDYKALASNYQWGVLAGMTVMLDKLEAHPNDIDAATKAYNGRGPRADEYLADFKSRFEKAYGVNIA